MSVLFVSHDMAAITRLCDRVLWLNAGEIVKIGPASEVVPEYQNSAWALSGQDGREIGAVKTSDDVFVRIGMRVLQSGFSVRYTLHVFGRGVVVFRARPPQDWPVDNPGLYTVTARIPRRVLAPIIYSIGVEAVMIRGTDWHPLTAHNALSFQAFDADSSQRDHVGGLVSPHVGWEIEQVSEAPAREAELVDRRR
jgi:hypothetical protein